eukprot:1033650-Rhodomonas_salina.1
MVAMFRGAPVFNVDISRWNTSAVTDMSYVPLAPSLARPPFLPPSLSVPSFLPISVLAFIRAFVAPVRASSLNVVCCSSKLRIRLVAILLLTRSPPTVRAAVGGVASRPS